LVDRGLIVRYFVDEAASGQGPSQLLDAAPSPLNLGITYSTALSFAEVASNRALNWTSGDAAGDARVSLGSTKINSALQGSTSGTIEVVVNVTALTGPWAAPPL